MLLKLYNEIKILKKTFKTKHVVYWMNNQLNDTSLAPSTYRKIIFVLIMCNVHYLLTQPTKWTIYTAHDGTHHFFIGLCWLELKAPKMFGVKPFLTKNSYIIFLNAPFVSIKKP